MLIFNKVKKFNPDTGEPIDRWEPTEIRCDYTGELLDGNYYCSYQLSYNRQDPCYGSDGDEYKFWEEFQDVEMYTFLSETYHFASDAYSGYFAEKEMMEEALKNADIRGSIWENCYTFDAMCRVARIATAKKLIKDGIIITKQLYGY